MKLNIYGLVLVPTYCGWQIDEKSIEQIVNRAEEWHEEREDEKSGFNQNSSGTSLVSMTSSGNHYS